MITAIKEHKVLKKYICQECAENNVKVSISPAIKQSDIVIVKVDDFYNKEVVKPPPSVDCLISIHVSGQSYKIYIIELKDINSPKQFKIVNIIEKFKATVADFMMIRFKDIYCNDSYTIKDLKMYFVTNPYGWKNDEFLTKKIAEKRSSTKMEYFQHMPLIRFRGKGYSIQHEMPDPLICK